MPFPMAGSGHIAFPVGNGRENSSSTHVISPNSWSRVNSNRGVAVGKWQKILAELGKQPAFYVKELLPKGYSRTEHVALLRAVNPMLRRDKIRCGKSAESSGAMGDTRDMQWRFQSKASAEAAVKRIEKLGIPGLTWEIYPWPPE
jgi:hypothetical protein